jgi:hypothetical protein
MITAITLKEILDDLSEVNEIGCTYDFRQKYGIGLASLQTLGYAKVIRSRIPACGDHCEKFNDCEFISLFEKRKSKSKFKLETSGKNLQKRLSMLSTNEAIYEEVKNDLMNTKIYDAIQSLLIDYSDGISIEQLVTAILKQKTFKLYVIRETFKDILDLLLSTHLLMIKEGILHTYA